MITYCEIKKFFYLWKFYFLTEFNKKRKVSLELIIALFQPEAKTIGKNSNKCKSSGAYSEPI